MGHVQHYYQAINAAAAGIADHHEKQKFLKVVYETFYKSYNPKAADKLGVVYTPNEIVRFMVESTDYLLHHHFNKQLEDKGVEILDPATGTGTFICDIIDYIRKDKVEYKYTHELHANEVAILPYYISNLNIEFTYKQKTGQYKEYENLCFVDTLDNLAFGFKGKQMKAFESISEENTLRIKRQNEKKISVVIGNPPYNANQQNENDNNKNRVYPGIDKRIKETFIAHSTAQKTKLYDMYSRFYRWAFDRLEDNGIIAFVTNRSFIDSRTFDGFRKSIQDDFDYCYIVDTKSDVRTNPKIAGTTHNIFGIQTGVAIMFLVRKEQRENKTCHIQYISLDDFWPKEQKLQWLAENKLQKILFEWIRPDAKNNWINLADTDFETLLPLANKNVKAGKSKEALFELFSTGISTNRDEWIIDISKSNLSKKMTFFAKFYNNNSKAKKFDTKIKWSRNLKNRFIRGLKEAFNKERIIKFNYRPYNPVYLYHSDVFIDEHGITGMIFNKSNIAICITGNNSTKPFQALGVNTFPSLDFLEKTQCLPLYRYTEDGYKVDNITDWGIEQFCKHYGFKCPPKPDTTPAPIFQPITTFDAPVEYAQQHLGDNEVQMLHEPAAVYGKPIITKEDIFYYVYAVLHHPVYRKKYELNLKRDFPRIPFYDDFFKWRNWGRELMDLHINYEEVKPFGLKITTIADKEDPKAKLKAEKETGEIVLDENTVLSGVPPIAWDYKLGNRSAIEWVLDQYKESTPKDPTIAEMFDTYRFADYKTQVIDLLNQVCTVSVETMNIINKMPGK